jgi:hypothetical protein
MRKARFLILVFSLVAIACASKPVLTEDCPERAPSSGGPQCRALFDDKPTGPSFSLRSNYDQLRSEELRLGPTENGVFPVLSKKVYSLEHDQGYLQSEILEPQMKPSNWKFESSPASKEMLQRNLQSWMASIKEAMDFVLRQYADRREHWPVAFLEKLRKMAEEYKFYSTYIAIKYLNTATGETTVFGELRLIAERDGRLPMEEYLGIHLNSKGAKKYEPGNFAINKSVNQYTFGEILVHLIETILDKSKNQESHFYTYADRQSLAMYKMLGFKPVPREDLKLGPAVEMDDRGRILKDGVAWTPLQASREGMELLLAQYLSGDLQNHDADVIRQTIRARNQHIKNNTVFHDRVFRGQFHYADEVLEPGVLYLRKKKGPHGEPRLELLFGKANKGSAMFRGWESFSIPDAPLYEGFREEWSEPEVKHRVTYSNGVLIHRQESGDQFTSYSFRISADLSTVESLKIEGTASWWPMEAYF